MTIRDQINDARRVGRDVVVVVGLGFVGTAVAANLARTAGEAGPAFFVVGLDQDTPDGRNKVEALNRGEPPVYASDPSLCEVYARAQAETHNIAGTVDTGVLEQADVVVCCVNLDLKRDRGQTERLAMDTSGYAALMRAIGERVRPGTLITVESTLPLGMCDRVLYPALCEGQRAQGLDPQTLPPLLAFCYERVMPGPGYLDSVNNYWRAVGGINRESVERAKAFLGKFVNVDRYPLWIHKSTRGAELAKLMENAYRATNIAFIEEWSRIAEAAEIDLFDVVSSIRVRKGTHDNMMFPGLGVGGYCLTKDALLAAYGAEHLIGIPAALPFSRKAILTNERMPLRAVEWIAAHFGDNLAGRNVLLLGLTYRPQVTDTRSSPAEIVARALQTRGASVRAFDPLLAEWPEMPEVMLVHEPVVAMQFTDAVIICLPDRSYASFLHRGLAETLPTGAIVVDAWNLVSDETAAAMRSRGVVLRTYGRGDRQSGKADV